MVVLLGPHLGPDLVLGLALTRLNPMLNPLKFKLKINENEVIFETLFKHVKTTIVWF